MFATGVSFRALSTVLESAFDVANVPNSFCTSSAYLYKSYQRLLKEKENKYENFIREDKSYGTVCFDHQNTQKITGKFEGTTHRLAIVWYSNKTHNILAMVAISDKTAESQAVAINETCENFSIENHQIVGLACDNENTNVGIHGGTCILLERALNKSLLRLMCRHHIYEIIIKDVYHNLFDSDTPNNLFYSILKEEWANLRERNFPFTIFNEESFSEELNLRAYEAFEQLKNRAISELRAQSRNHNIRDDYREVTQLALKFFGEIQKITKGNQVKFRTLINPSNARFMATIIQGLKCYLFRKSFEWDSQEGLELKYNIKRFVIFAAVIYIRYWNRSSMLFNATVNDLNLLQELQTYKLLDESVAKVAINAFSRHLNYMGEELAPLSLFSEKLSVQEKNAIAKKLCMTADKIMPLRNLRSNHISFAEDIDYENYDWSSKSVIDLVGGRSHFFFDIMNLPKNFLRVNASQWENNDSYNKAKQIIQDALICINDGSERVISNCKNKLQKQRCRKESTFRQNILNLHINSNV